MAVVLFAHPSQRHTAAAQAEVPAQDHVAAAEAGSICTLRGGRALVTPTRLSLLPASFLEQGGGRAEGGAAAGNGQPGRSGSLGGALLDQGPRIQPRLPPLLGQDGRNSLLGGLGRSSRESGRAEALYPLSRLEAQWGVAELTPV